MSHSRAPGLPLTAIYGAFQLNRIQQQRCEKDYPNSTNYGLPPGRRYRIQFLFDGEKFRVTPGSEAAAKLFTRVEQ